MNNIRVELENRYPQLRDKAKMLVPVLLAVITRYPLQRQDLIPNSDLTVDSLVRLGLFRWKAPGFLECPFVLVWLLATWSQHQTLAHFRLEAYNEAQSKNNSNNFSHVSCNAVYWALCC